MTYQFDLEQKSVTLNLSFDEFDTLMVLRHASMHYITPLKEGSALSNMIDNLDWTNHYITVAKFPSQNQTS